MVALVPPEKEAVTILPSTDLHLMGRPHSHAIPRGVVPAQRLQALARVRETFETVRHFASHALVRLGERGLAVHHACAAGVAVVATAVTTPTINARAAIGSKPMRGSSTSGSTGGALGGVVEVWTEGCSS